MIKSGREQTDTLNEFLFDSKRWVEKAVNQVVNLISTNTSQITPMIDNEAARSLVNHTSNFN